MGYFTATWTPGRFPLTDVLSLAVWVDGKDVAADIGNAVYNRVLKDEFKNVKVLELNGCIQSFIWTKKPVSKMADLKGMKLRSPGGHQTNYIKSLGAEPIFMPLGDVYLAMETGTVDGIVTCPPLILAYKLHEVAKHATVLTFGCVSEGTVMNLNSWNKLPDDQKKIVEAVCTNPFKTTGGLTRDDYKVIMSDIAKAGVKLIELPAGRGRTVVREIPGGHPEVGRRPGGQGASGEEGRGHHERGMREEKRPPRLLPARVEEGLRK